MQEFRRHRRRRVHDGFFQRRLDYFVDSINRLEVQFVAHVFGNVFEVGFVARGQNDAMNARTMRSENLRKGRKETLYDTLNRSINETLPRSVLTHVTTFAATLALLIFAGEVIRPFAWVMAFGIVTGTFSSIYVAAPVLLWIERKWPRRTAARQSSSTATPTSRTRRSPATATR